MIQWMCLGGPLHGQWLPPGDKPVAAPAPAGASMVYGLQTVQRTGVVVAYASTPRPIMYYPRQLRMAGWRVAMTMYVEARLYAGLGALPAGLVMPGGVQGEGNASCPVCRWCFGWPLPGLASCSKVECITALAAVASLEVLTADDAKRWSNDA